MTLFARQDCAYEIISTATCSSPSSPWQHSLPQQLLAERRGYRHTHTNDDANGHCYHHAHGDDDACPNARTGNDTAQHADGADRDAGYHALSELFDFFRVGNDGVGSDGPASFSVQVGDRTRDAVTVFKNQALPLPTTPCLNQATRTVCVSTSTTPAIFARCSDARLSTSVLLSSCRHF